MALLNFVPTQECTLRPGEMSARPFTPITAPDILFSRIYSALPDPQAVNTETGYQICPSCFAALLGNALIMLRNQPLSSEIIVAENARWLDSIKLVSVLNDNLWLPGDFIRLQCWSRTFARLIEFSEQINWPRATGLKIQIDEDQNRIVSPLAIACPQRTPVNLRNFLYNLAGVTQQACSYDIPPYTDNDLESIYKTVSKYPSKLALHPSRVLAQYHFKEYTTNYGFLESYILSALRDAITVQKPIEATRREIMHRIRGVVNDQPPKYK